MPLTKTRLTAAAAYFRSAMHSSGLEYPNTEQAIIKLIKEAAFATSLDEASTNLAITEIFEILYKEFHQVLQQTPDLYSLRLWESCYKYAILVRRNQQVEPGEDLNPPIPEVLNLYIPIIRVLTLDYIINDIFEKLENEPQIIQSANYHNIISILKSKLSEPNVLLSSYAPNAAEDIVHSVCDITINTARRFFTNHPLIAANLILSGILPLIITPPLLMKIINNFSTSTSLEVNLWPSNAQNYFYGVLPEEFYTFVQDTLSLVCYLESATSHVYLALNSSLAIISNITAPEGIPSFYSDSAETEQIFYPLNDAFYGKLYSALRNESAICAYLNGSSSAFEMKSYFNNSDDSSGGALIGILGLLLITSSIVFTVTMYRFQLLIAENLKKITEAENTIINVVEFIQETSWLLNAEATPPDAILAISEDAEELVVANSQTRTDSIPTNSTFSLMQQVLQRGRYVFNVVPQNFSNTAFLIRMLRQQGILSNPVVANNISLLELGNGQSSVQRVANADISTQVIKRTADSIEPVSPPPKSNAKPQ